MVEELESIIKGLSRISQDFENAKKKSVDYGFNVFRLCSDFYYRENFHSDIICAFIDTNGAHGEKSLFLDIFIDFLNSLKPELKIDKKFYEKATAKREPGRIDILIEGEDHCIIIENKINNAVDQNLQIPRYYEYCNKNSLTTDAIVYLTLYHIKNPTQEGWKDEMKDKIKPILLPIPSIRFENEKMDLCTGWLSPSILATKNVEAQSILLHYKNLIKILSSENMKDPLILEYYKTIPDAKSFDAVVSISEMLQSLPNVLSKHIAEKYNSDNRVMGTFTTISAKNNRVSFIREKYPTKGTDLLLEIEWNSKCVNEYKKGFVLYFWYNGSNRNADIRKDFEGILPLESFEKDPDKNLDETDKFSIIRYFDPNDLNGLYDFLDNEFLPQLKEHINKQQ